MMYQHHTIIPLTCWAVFHHLTDVPQIFVNRIYLHFAYFVWTQVFYFVKDQVRSIHYQYLSGQTVENSNVAANCWRSQPLKQTGFIQIQPHCHKRLPPDRKVSMRTSQKSCTDTNFGRYSHLCLSKNVVPRMSKCGDQWHKTKQTCWKSGSTDVRWTCHVQRCPPFGG